MAEDPGCDDQDSVKLIPNAPEETEQLAEKDPEADVKSPSDPNGADNKSDNDEAPSLSPVKDDDSADQEQVAVGGDEQSDVLNEQKEPEVEEKFVSHEFAEEPKYEMLGSQGDDEVFEQKSNFGCYQEQFKAVEEIRTFSQATDIIKPPSSRQLLILPPVASTAKETRAKVAKRCCLTISMTVLTVGYAVAGGFLFSHLENHRETVFNAKVDKWKNDTAILLATELRQVSPHEEVWAKKVFKYLDVFERDLLRASSLGYRRPDDEDRGRRWTFRSALFFSVSLMTTTGYGSMTPRSEWSRAAVAGYSMIGIPLAVTWFATLGSAMGIFWNWLFDNLCCHLCGPAAARVHPKFAMPASTATPTPEGNSRLSIPNGFKHHPRHRSHSRASTLSEVLVPPTVRPSGHSNPDRAVAIVLAIALFVVYFVFGSAALAITEGWAISESLYFNFVMLVTVGPGCQELETDAAESAIRQNAFYLVYLVVGFCLMSMVFYLLYAFCSSAKSDRLAREEQTEFTAALY